MMVHLVILYPYDRLFWAGTCIDCEGTVDLKDLKDPKDPTDPKDLKDLQYLKDLKDISKISKISCGILL